MANQSQKKVIIVGAGFSGLSVAYHLCVDNKNKKEDFDVTILEARDRIGGRVHPHDLEGTIVDLGGQWVHESSPRNPIRQLMEMNGISFQREGFMTKMKKQLLPRKSAVFGMDGNEIKQRTYKEATKVYYKALNNYDEMNIDVNTSRQELVDRCVRLADRSDEFMQVIHYLSHLSACYEGGRLRELSVYLDEIYKSLGGPDKYPEGGYNEVLNVVSKKIGMDRIKLNCVVHSISYNSNAPDGGVTVTLDNGEKVHGDFCVLTVPLGVMQKRKLQFDPQLPISRWAAIDAIGMGLLDKVILKFEKRFWEYESFALSNTDETLVKNFYDCSDEVGAPLLVVFLGGDAARRVDSPDGLTDEEAVSEAIQALCKIFGEHRVLKPVASKVTRWNLDPFAHGAYSFAKVGSTEADYDEVAAPIGNLLFAGEHTHKTSHSTVHGAWATGQREANRLGNLLAKSR